MKLSFQFELSKPHLPKDYRRGFASIIKDALSRADKNLYNFYYTGTYKLKPFTFSVYFPQGSDLEEEKFQVGNQAVLKFSTSDNRLAATLFNGMLYLRNNPYPLFDNEVKLISMFLHPPKKIESDKAKFKLIGNMLVTNKNCHIHVNGNQYDIYLSPDEEGFDEGLRFLIKEQINKFLGIDYSFPFEYEFIKETIKVVPVWHYNQWNKSIKGEIEIKSHPRVLQLLYDTGIGARRSQGFGMLEVIE